MTDKPYGEIDLSKARWRRSSTAGSGPAVEVAFVDDMVAVRDSEDSPVLLFTLGEWEAFKAGARLGEFNIKSLDPPQA